MAKRIISLSQKGAYEVPPEKLSFAPDLPYSQGSFRGEEETRAPFYKVAVQKVLPVVRILRVSLEDGRFIDALDSYPFGEPFLIGIGKLDEKGEPIYESNELLGKPVSEFTLGEGISDSEIREEVDAFFLMAADFELKGLQEALAEKGLSIDEFKKNPREGLKALAEVLTPREFRSYFPRIAVKIIEKTDGKLSLNPEKLNPPKTLDLSKATEIPLNYAVIGQTPYREAVVAYTERVKLLSPTLLAKELSKDEDYKTLVEMADIRLKDIREKSWKIRRIQEKADKASPETGKLVAKLLSSKTPEELAEVLKEAHARRKERVKRILESSPLFEKDKLLVKTKDGSGYFLRSIQSAAGITPRNLSSLKGVIYAAVPRPIQVEGKWRVQRVYKPLTQVFKKENGKYLAVPTSADGVDMVFGYRTFKVLSAMAGLSKPGKGQEWSWSQIRALAGEGFENFKGLDALEKEFSQFKGAGKNWGGFIKYVKGVLGEELFTKDEGNEEEKKARVKEKLLNDPVVKEFIVSFTDFLENRRKLKPIPLPNLVKDVGAFLKAVKKEKLLWAEKRRYLTYKAFENKEEFLKEAEPLVKAGVVEVGEDGKISFNEEKLKESKLWKEWNALLERGYAGERTVAYHPVSYEKVKQVEGKFKGLLKEKVRLYDALLSLAATYSIIHADMKNLIEKVEEKPDRDARILAGEFAYHLLGETDGLNLEEKEYYGVLIESWKKEAEKVKGGADIETLEEDIDFGEEFESADTLGEAKPQVQETQQETQQVQTETKQETPPLEELEEEEVNELESKVERAEKTTLEEVSEEEFLHQALEGEDWDIDF